MDKHDLLEEKLKKSGIPYERKGTSFIVALIFHADLLKFAEEVGLVADT